jgi:hypothetical protein
MIQHGSLPEFISGENTLPGHWTPRNRVLRPRVTQGCNQGHDLFRLGFGSDSLTTVWGAPRDHDAYKHILP